MKRRKARKSRVFRLVFNKHRRRPSDFDVLVAIQEKLSKDMYRHIEVARLDPVYELEVREVLPKPRKKKVKR